MVLRLVDSVFLGSLSFQELLLKSAGFSLQRHADFVRKVNLAGFSLQLRIDLIKEATVGISFTVDRDLTAYIDDSVYASCSSYRCT